jgi:hypothetical protein
MQEDFIDWIWRNRLFEQQELTCETGETLEILNPGIRNSDSGPDYFNARMKIDGMVWIGNVELHVKASDWLRHKHHYDAMYENVILHVVHEPDAIIYRKDGSRVPELSLRNRYQPDLLNQYLDLVQGAAHWIPCERLLQDVPALHWHNWLARVMTTRLQQRCIELEELLHQTGNNWEEAFYRKLAAGFGFRVNKDPMTMLAASLPLSLIRKQAEQPDYCEALLFGQAGMLQPDMRDYYGRNLFGHYQHLKKLYGLNPLAPHLWKYGRLRPANFPTRRIAQLAALLQKTPSLFSSLVHCEEINRLKDLLKSEPDGYWKRHYQFDEEVPQSSAAIGPNSIENLIINSVIPFVFYYGRYHGLSGISEKALSWLEHCLPEDNAILRKWDSIGIHAGNALESQALLFLKREYCEHKKCVNCGIGQYLLNSK